MQLVALLVSLVLVVIIGVTLLGIFIRKAPPVSSTYCTNDADCQRRLGSSCYYCDASKGACVLDASCVVPPVSQQVFYACSSTPFCCGSNANLNIPVLGVTRPWLQDSSSCHQVLIFDGSETPSDTLFAITTASNGSIAYMYSIESGAKFVPDEPPSDCPYPCLVAQENATDSACALETEQATATGVLREVETLKAKDLVDCEYAVSGRRFSGPTCTLDATGEYRSFAACVAATLDSSAYTVQGANCTTQGPCGLCLGGDDCDYPVDVSDGDRFNGVLGALLQCNEACGGAAGGGWLACENECVWQPFCGGDSSLTSFVDCAMKRAKDQYRSPSLADHVGSDAIPWWPCLSCDMTDVRNIFESFVGQPFVWNVGGSTSYTVRATFSSLRSGAGTMTFTSSHGVDEYSSGSSLQERLCDSLAMSSTPALYNSACLDTRRYTILACSPHQVVLLGDDNDTAFAIGDIVPGYLLRNICDDDTDAHSDLNPQLSEVYSSACASTLADPANDDQPILFVRRIRQSKALACPRQTVPIPVTAVEKPYVLFCGALSKVLK